MVTSVLSRARSWPLKFTGSARSSNASVIISERLRGLEVDREREAGRPELKIGEIKAITPSAARGSPHELPALLLRRCGPRRERPPACHVVGRFYLETSQFQAQSRLQRPLLA